jgi:hypothetical protein
MVEKRNVYRLLVGKPEGKRPLGKDIRGWIIFGWIFYDCDGVMWTGLVWLSLGTGGGRCEFSFEPLGSIKCCCHFYILLADYPALPGYLFIPIL